MVGNPQGMVVAGTGIDHNELVDMTRLYFGHLEQTTPTEGRTIPSVYRGGQHSIRQPTPSEYAAPSPHNDGLTRVAVAFELGGWHSDDLVPTCVLQTLLGGGNAFSAGGPGKGMYSRLYRQVLNRYVWAESAEAFTAFSSETGLFGMSGGSQPYKSRDVTMVLVEHMMQLASELVTDEEIDRARNMLKCNVLSQLESRLILFEDIGRQILTYGHREDTATMCAKVDAVTKEDLQRIARKALRKPPTIAAVGRDLSRVPSQAEVASWL
jgi:processing peptidase subunit alpha